MSGKLVAGALIALLIFGLVSAVLLWAPIINRGFYT